MLQVIALIAVLGLVFAVKAACIMRQSDELIAAGASFSWMRPREYDDIVASAEATIEELAVEGDERSAVAAQRVPSLA